MTYVIPEEADVFVPETQDVNNNANESENEGIVLEESNLMEQENRNNITIALNDMSNEIKKFKYFRKSVESKLCLLEDQIISSKTSDTSNSDTSGFIVTILRDRISSLEGQLKSKDAVIEFLTKQLLTSNVNNSQMKNCDNRYVTIIPRKNLVIIKLIKETINKRKRLSLQETQC